MSILLIFARQSCSALLCLALPQTFCAVVAKYHRKCTVMGEHVTSVVVHGLEMSSRTNFEPLVLALKLKSLLTTLHVQSEILSIKQPVININVDVSASTGAFVGTVCLIAVRRSVSGQTGCRRCGKIGMTLVSVHRLYISGRSKTSRQIRQTVSTKASVEAETSKLISKRLFYSKNFTLN